MQNTAEEIQKNTIAEWFVRVILQDGDKKCVFVRQITPTYRGKSLKEA